MHSESIHSRMGVGIFLKFHFVLKAPMCSVCDEEVFPSFRGRPFDSGGGGAAGTFLK